MNNHWLNFCRGLACGFAAMSAIAIGMRDGFTAGVAINLLLVVVWLVAELISE